MICASDMEAKLLEYRARKRREELINKAKETLHKIVTFNVSKEIDEKEMNTVDIPDDSTPLLPNADEYIERAPSPVLSSDNESEDIGTESNSLYARFSRTSLVVMSFVLWVVIFLIFIQIEFGIIYLIVSALVGIYFNTRTGPKKNDEISAYSVFNRNCESIDGTLKAEQLEKQFIYGPIAFR